jgi:hypothetical protein
MIVLFDIHGVAHLVHNEREVRETHERWRYVENWQVRVACNPKKEAHVWLELHGSSSNPGINQADLSDETKGHFPTCILCVGAINTGVR